MSTRIEDAVSRHRHGHNCAQAVLCAYCDLYGADEQLMYRAAEGLGGGMGCMEGTCGALSAACILAGLKNADGNVGHSATRGSTGRLSKAIVKGFEERIGATKCADIKGVGTGHVLAPCEDCVKTAAELVDEILYG
ncbi:MAG: C-GCAxxG-C-C family protein [Anaerovoracaceae bacterium]